MRRKTMKQAEFQPIFDRRWVRVDMTAMLPDWMESIPKERVLKCLASGDDVQPVRTEVAGRVFEDVVGGIDVLRIDPADARFGVILNKDHYVVLRDLRGNALMVEGPFKDDEHWLTAEPERFKNVEVLIPEDQADVGAADD